MLGLGAVVRRELGRVVPGRPELCVRSAGAVPLLQRDLSGRRCLDPVGPARDRPPAAPCGGGGAESSSPLVLALQVLGGDPEAAYLTAVCGAGYAVVLANCARRSPACGSAGWTALGAVCVWVAATLGLACARIASPRFLVMNGLVLAAWAGRSDSWLAWRWHRRPAEARAGAAAGRAGGCLRLAVALAAVQVLPVLEFASQSRAGVRGAARSMSTISAWTLSGSSSWSGRTRSGRNAPENRSWLQAVPPAGDHDFGSNRSTWEA